MDEYDDYEGGGGLPDFLRDPFGIPRRRWIWMLLGLVVGLGATAGYALHGSNR